MSSGSLKDQVAIITGAGLGIGFEIARQLAVGGASVILNDIDETRTRLASEKISKEGVCYGMCGDAADTGFIHQMVNEAATRFGKLTMAVANAGITLYGDFFHYKAESLDEVMRANLKDRLFLCQAAATKIKKQN